MRVRCLLTACPGSFFFQSSQDCLTFSLCWQQLIRKYCSHRGRGRGERGDHSGSESESSRGARKNHRGRRKRSGSYKLVHTAYIFPPFRTITELVFRWRLMSSGERCSVSRVEGRAGCRRRRSESPATSTPAQKRSPSWSPP